MVKNSCAICLDTRNVIPHKPPRPMSKMAAPETVLTPEMETGTRKTIVRKAVRISNPSLLTWHGALLGQRLAE